MRKVAAIITVFLFFTFLTNTDNSVVAQTCSTAGQRCVNTDECKTYEVACGSYKCLEVARSDVPRKTCQLVGEPIQCAKANTICLEDQDCRDDTKACRTFRCIEVRGREARGEKNCLYDANLEPNKPTPTSTVVPSPTAVPLPPHPCKDGKCHTAIGTIDTNAIAFIQTIVRFILGLASGIAFIFILYSGFKLIVSRGDPEAVQGAKETLTSSIVGLLFIIFAIAILRFITIDLLALPGFGR